MRTTLLVAIVAFAVVLAGCAGGGGGADPTPSNGDDSTDTPTPSDEGDSTDTPTPSNGDGSTPSRSSGDIEVHYLDVGQADAALVIAPNGETILVDSGDWRDDGSTVLAALEDRDVDRIDHLVTTHAHADHIGGHAAVIDRYEERKDGIGAIYDSGVPSTSATYERYLDAVERHDVTLYEVAAGDSFEAGDVSVRFHNPPEDPESDDIDENSLTFTVEYGETTFLFSGDAGTRAEQRMVDERGDGDALAADVYQAGHHGSSSSSSDPFVSAVDPAVAVISSDYESQYGHPHDEVLERFADHGVETYWTGIHGDVVVTSDGSSDDLEVEPERDATTDPLEIRDEKPPNDALAIEPSAGLFPPRVASG